MKHRPAFRLARLTRDRRRGSRMYAVWARRGTRAAAVDAAAEALRRARVHVIEVSHGPVIFAVIVRRREPLTKLGASILERVNRLETVALSQLADLVPRRCCAGAYSAVAKLERDGLVAITERSFIEVHSTRRGRVAQRVSA